VRVHVALVVVLVPARGGLLGVYCSYVGVVWGWVTVRLCVGSSPLVAGAVGPSSRRGCVVWWGGEGLGC
jgi:hypothetical protein